MSTLELAFRVAALTQIALLILHLVKARRAQVSYPALAALLFGIACYISAPFTIEQGMRSATSYPFVVMATLIPVLFWYFCCTVFSDNFQLKLWMIACAALFSLVGLLTFCDYANSAQCTGGANQLTRGLSFAGKFAWTLAAFWMIAKDWRADLVQSRRNFRRLLALAVGCYILVILTVELFVNEETIATLEFFNSTLIVISVTGVTLHLLALQNNNVFARIAANTEPVPPSATSTPLARQVLHIMQQERRYAEEGLTIDSLAKSLGVPTPELRFTINGELGYRNFNAFVNSHRIEEVAQRLGRDEFHATPLLTLALDAGFRSMAPFNRCFKDRFKVTPSEYRSSLDK